MHIPRPLILFQVDYPLPVRRRAINHKYRRAALARGFSLIEVTLALGIVSFALITILGVMPVGLNSLRDAVDETTESQIIRQIGAEATLLPFASIQTEMEGKTYYFDDEGQPQQSSDQNTRYTASVSVVDPDYPGVGAAPKTGLAALPSQLQTLRIELVTAASSDAVLKNTNQFAVTVANYYGN